MSERHNNFMYKFLMYMGIVMLYITTVYIVPIELNNPFGTNEIIAISIVYIPSACWYFNNTFTAIEKRKRIEAEGKLESLENSLSKARSEDARIIYQSYFAVPIDHTGDGFIDGDE